MALTLLKSECEYRHARIQHKVEITTIFLFVTEKSYTVTKRTRTVLVPRDDYYHEMDENCCASNERGRRWRTRRANSMRFLWTIFFFFCSDSKDSPKCIFYGNSLVMQRPISWRRASFMARNWLFKLESFKAIQIKCIIMMMIFLNKIFSNAYHGFLWQRYLKTTQACFSRSQELNHMILALDFAIT